MTDPIAKRQRAKKACPVTGDHAWLWAENVQQPTSKAKRLTVTTKGFYQCACGATQLGPKQRQPAKPRKRARRPPDPPATSAGKENTP